MKKLLNILTVLAIFSLPLNMYFASRVATGSTPSNSVAWIVLILLSVLIILSRLYFLIIEHMNAVWGKGQDDRLQERSKAAPVATMMHSYAQPKFWIFTTVGLVILLTLSNAYSESTNSSLWGNITFGLAGIFYLAIGIRFFITRSSWPTIKRYAEHSGWSETASVNGRDLIPLHFAPPPQQNRTRTVSEVHVLVRSDARDSNTVLVVEDFYFEGGFFGKEFASSLCFIVTRLPKRVPGWVRLLPEEKTFLKVLRDSDTEFISFNKKFYVHARPEKLRTLVLSPDLMNWYYHLPINPWLHVENGLACLSVGPKPTYVQLQQLLEAAQQLPDYLKRSGAYV